MSTIPLVDGIFYRLLTLINATFSTTFLSMVAFAYLSYCASLTVYRLILSPLAKFPGPKLAAVTDWYEVYYDILIDGGQGGQFARHIASLHRKYGPLVRITPHELHINDPEFFAELYGPSTRSKPIDKSSKFRYRFGIPNAAFSTPAAEQHQERRAALNPFFSKQRIRNLHGRLTEIVERISSRLATEYVASGKVINFNNVWSSLTMDTTTALAFSRPTECSAAANFESPLALGVQALTWSAHFNAHFGFVNDIMALLPESVLLRMMPGVKPILEFRASIRSQVEAILEGNDEKSEDAAHPTIFHDIVNSSLPASDKTLERLTEEALSIVGAGMETTKWVLTVATFHLLDSINTDTLARLQDELTAAMPDPKEILPYVELEKLRYLTAVILESLRISYGQVQRLPRINRLHEWHYKEWTIPRGVMVGSSGFSVHSNESVFPESRVFRPERWLGNPSGPRGGPLTNYLVAFGRGSRGCIGKELAYMELYVALATIFRRFRLELFETTRNDADFVLDMVAPMPSRESKGVRVLAQGVLP